MDRKKFYFDLLERVLWTFVQSFAAAWIVLPDFSAEVVKVAAVAGAVAVVKCLLATQVGASNTAATLPLAEDTEAGRFDSMTILLIVIATIAVVALLVSTGVL